MENKELETEKGHALGKAAKIIAICCFCLVMAALLYETVSDVIIFSKQILQFIGGIVATALLFVFMLICFVASFILIFGFYLFQQQGFWPIKVTKTAFLDMMGEISFDNISPSLFSGVRISLIVLCVISLVSAIVSLSLRKAAINEGFIDKNKHIKKFDVTTIVFSSLGIAVSAIALLTLR